MKEFIIKLILFLLPFIIVPIINYTVDSFYLFGRRKQIEAIAETLLSGKDIVAARSFNDRYLHKQIIRKMKQIPHVVALGSSQTLELKTSHLGQPPGTFFNHSVAGGNIHDMIAFLGCYKKRGPLPKKIIIGLSTLMFDKSFHVPFFEKRWEIMESEYYYLQALMEKRNPLQGEFFLRVKTTIQEYKLLFSFNYALTNLKKIKYFLKDDPLFNISKDVSVDEDVLSPDGSLHVSFTHNDTETVKRVQNFIDELKAKKSHEIINIELFKKLVDYILSSGPQLIFLFPPYHPMLYKELSTNKALEFYRELEQLVMDIAISRHIPVYWAYDPGILGLESKDFWDATHLHEYAVKKITTDFVQMEKRNQIMVQQ